MNTLTIEVLDDATNPAFVTLHGRLRWAFANLYRAGANGCTPLDAPGPRRSAYVHRLRQLGLAVETIHESHGGEFAGHHARYRLTSRVRVHGDGDVDG